VNCLSQKKGDLVCFQKVSERDASLCASLSSSLTYVCTKMCCLSSVSSKALPIPGFPDGWRFIFDEIGLRILASNGREYRALEKALGQNRKSLKDVDVPAFYSYVGCCLDPGARSSNPTGAGQDIKKRALSDKFEVGARCFAKFYDDVELAWFWGTITNIAVANGKLVCSVCGRWRAVS
jgi:hypothetical protein